MVKTYLYNNCNYTFNTFKISTNRTSLYAYSYNLYIGTLNVLVD